MAPIPQILDEETKALIGNLQRREKDLIDYQVPRLRDCKGPLSVQQRLAAELKEDLDSFGKQTEILEIRAEDVPRKTERIAVQQLVEEFREFSARIRKDMRSALLHSKKTIDSQAKSHRQELFAGAVSPPDSRNVEEKATDDALMKASNDVTEALRRTIGLMQSELERSVVSHQILEQSTATLRATSTQHDILSSAAHTSKQLITALERADWLDRLLILASLTFFVLVVLFIIKQRILDRGVRLAFWWTRYVPLPNFGYGGNATVEKMEEIVEKESAAVVGFVKSGTQMIKGTVSSVLAEASSTLADFTNEVLEAVDSSPLSPVAESATASASLDSLSSSLTTTTYTIATTSLDALSETVSSALQHSEL